MQTARPPRPKPPNWPAQSSLAVFVRNLQLLQLDCHDDWPGITVRSLAPSSQNQRQRIKAIEWALYHLVAIWDPETARDKLRPFFPPLEPLQSVNLRAALFRVLSDLKKNGDLGRESILRKSMLDDCKGDKFDELLALFSTAVLRKSLAGAVEDNVALRLSLAEGVTRDEYERMLPLILAHRVSLRSTGERRARIRSTHDQFAQLLDRKKDQLTARAKTNVAPAPDQDGETDSLAREVRANWLGSAEWADTLVDGGAQGSSDAFLELPFDAAWSKATASTVEDLTTSSTPDLLVDLESRVFHQRARLHRWRQYGHSIHRQGRVQSNGTSNQPLAFRDHQTLTVASISKAVRQPLQRVSPTAEDRSLLFSMTEALARINGTTHARRRRTPPGGTRDPSSRRSPLSNEPDPLGEPEPPQPAPEVTPSPPGLAVYNQPGNAGATMSEMDHQGSAKSSPVDDEPPIVHVTQDGEPPEPQPRPRAGHTALVERTRRSMSLFTPSPPAPERRESHRSHRPRASFPVNQFDTPRKQSPDYSRASTPHDELFEGHPDYASVFKSRPRVALSPVASPAVHFNPIDDYLDLGPATESPVEAEAEWAAVGSPSKGRGR
ncbi:HAUS augmin-like complex subunit 6 N-terminus-domain-containing protein [Aspergillus taichungensis]|uniref:HAUS augmin-like complex subunit 6 N-terminus-domain-containing protein n=1 Tax=Aspergillus taichungensis TaxID=482145 RepID=A0A2J5HGJ9_9EURO|nr:HAUS augmin-like complex subunit 6 N-terminus-domain-containing protein [Aspergillus taichungensis]